MTTRTIAAPTSGPEPFFVLPDAPLWDMQEAPYVSHALLTLMRRYSDRPDVFVASRGYLCSDTRSDRSEWLVPDCMISFGVSPEAATRRNGYVMSDHGKPLDFVLEVASETTGRRDYTVKRDRYAAFGVTEYFRFDSTGGEYHDRPLAGDRLVGGAYEPVPVTTDDAGNLRCYSETLDLDLCWEDGRLRFWDPETGDYLNDYDEAEDARLAERDARIATEAGRDWERDARLAAEARADAAEAELRRLRERLDL